MKFSSHEFSWTENLAILNIRCLKGTSMISDLIHMKHLRCGSNTGVLLTPKEREWDWNMDKELQTGSH